MKHFKLFTKITLLPVGIALMISLVSFVMLGGLAGKEPEIAFVFWVIGSVGAALYVVVTIIWFLCGLAWNLYRIVENKANSVK